MMVEKTQFFDKSPPMINYDIIGDIHGHARELVDLLNRLGYQDNGICFCHPDGNQAIFVGDLINRGPETIGVLNIVKAMHKNMQAHVVLGNHEFRLLQKFTINPEFISKEILKFIPWIQSLPLFLDLPDLRVVHAAWHFSSIEKLRDKKVKDEQFIKSTLTKGSELKLATEVILQGIKVRLPANFEYLDRFGIQRKKARIKWWEKPGRRISGANFFPKCIKYYDSFFEYDSKVEREHYDSYEKPVFYGHYCIPPEEEKITDNKICLDGCVSFDKVLWAYKFNRDTKINLESILNTESNAN